MKTIEIFQKFLQEGLDNKSSGIADGAAILAVGAAAFFGVVEPSFSFSEDKFYLYVYGSVKSEFCFMPLASRVMASKSDSSLIYVWELE